MNISTDVAIVGAGVAGTVAGVALAQKGLRVTLIDARPDFPPLFRAEKLEPDNVQALRRLGLFEQLLPHVGRIRAVKAAYDGRVFRIDRLEQYGLAYADLTNVLRAHLPASVAFKVGSVRGIEGGAELRRVRLADGEELTARLVVLASGNSRRLQASLGLSRRVVQKEQSYSFGFDAAAAAANGRPFDFDAVTYYPTTSSDRIAYLTLFKFREKMRANLFLFRSASDPWIRRFVEEPERMLGTAFPKLTKVIGDYRVVSRVESGCVDLYVMDGDPPPGVAVIGDAFQSPCPSTGLGLSKLLTDVEVLAECAPSWFSTPGLGPEKTSQYYRHPRKLAMDRHALQAADYERRFSSDRSLRWRIHRLRRHLGWRFESPSEHAGPAAGE